MNPILLVVVGAAAALGAGFLATSVSTPSKMGSLIFVAGFIVGFAISWGRIMDGIEWVWGNKSRFVSLAKDKLHYESLSEVMTQGGNVTWTQVGQVGMVTAGVTFAAFFIENIVQLIVGLMFGILTKVLLLKLGINFQGI